MQLATASALVAVFGNFKTDMMIVGGAERSETFFNAELENMIYLWSMPNIWYVGCTFEELLLLDANETLARDNPTVVFLLEYSSISLKPRRMIIESYVLFRTYGRVFHYNGRQTRTPFSCILFIRKETDVFTSVCNSL